MHINVLLNPVLYIFSEMDKLHPVVREEIDKMAGCTGEMARIRMVCKNFKDEASQIRVHHKTNLIDTDIYEEANTELEVMCCHFDLTILLNTNVLKLKYTLKGAAQEIWYLLQIHR